MAEFTQTMSGDSRYSIKLTVTEVIPSDYITTNKTNVNYTLTATKSGGSGYWNNNANNPVKVTINGTDVVNTNVAYDFRNATPKTITLASGTVTGIEHNADGSKTIAVSGYFKDNGNSLGSATASGNLTLTTIPRASQPSVQDVYGDLGDTFTINTNRASNSFTHTINIKVGSTTVETFTNVGASKSWTPTIATYAPYRPDGQFLIATVECTTFNGGTNLGTKSTSVQLFIPNNSTTKPTASISIAKGDSVVPSNWGVYVKGKSKLAVTITGTPKFSTTIASYSSTANGSNYNTSSYTTNELTSSGTFNVTATVTDKRGFTSSQATSSYTVQDYSNPQITTSQVYRCDSNGNQDDSGTYIKYIYGGSISSVSNKNSKTFTLKWKPKNGSDTTVGTWTDSYTCSKNGILSGFSTSTEYIFTFTATDSFTTTTITKEIGTEPDMMNFNASGKSMAFGGVSTRSATESVIDFKTTAQFKDAIVENIRSKNMLSPDNIIFGFYSINNGNYGTSTSACCTANKIEIDNTKNYVLSTSNTQTTSYMYVFYYNSSGTYLGYISTPFSVGLLKLNAYANYSSAKYVNFRFDVTIPNLINPMFEEGNSVTTYSPYQELNPDNFKNEEIVVGSIRSKNIYDPGSMPLQHGLWQSNGKIVTNAAGNYVVVPIKGGTTYSISRKYDNTTSGIQFLIATTANYPVVDETLLSYQNSSTDKQYTFTTPTNAKYLWLGLLGSGSPSEQQKAQAIDELQVETGSTSTNYMPYQNLDIQDSGWKNLTLLNGVTSRGSSYTPQYRKIGSFVYLRGQVTIPAHNAAIVMATLPEGYRPSMESRMLGLTSNNWIDTSGNLWSGYDNTERSNQVLQCLIIVD